MRWEFNAKTQGSRGAKRKAEVLSTKTNHRLVIARNPMLAVKSPRVIAPLRLCVKTLKEFLRLEDGGTNARPHPGPLPREPRKLSGQEGETLSGLAQIG